ncbi:MAG: TonB-dependent receptor [Flavobacteriaceae bacterium]
MSRFLHLFPFIFTTSVLIAQENKIFITDSIQQLDEVIIKANTILGNKFVAQNRTGASYFLSTEELNDFGYSDINRALKAVPGVNFYEEDGFGLRPNISLRGTSPQRSSKITLMEDGVLIAPAPYSSPAAYYFPSIARMEAVEILKGSSQVQYGPFTTGGVINMISTTIPEEKVKAKFQSSYGSYNSNQIYTSIGQSSENISYVIEYLSMSSDGFKKLNMLENTGFDITDLMGKIRIQSDKNSSTPQFFEVKYHLFDELSNETYLGITKQDFENTPFIRYATSQQDKMDAKQTQLMLTHSINLTPRFTIVTNGYKNIFSRNWYKLNNVVLNNVSKSLDDVLNNPLENLDFLNVLKGEVNSERDALILRANNRVYTSMGLQTKIDIHWYGNSGGFHDIEVGARYHFDEEDRFQWEDGYQIQNNSLSLTSQGAKGAKGNRIASATAFASYVLYKYKFNNFTFTPGIRMESINLKRVDYGSSNPNRNYQNSDVRENDITAFIPGIGFNYTYSNQVSFFGGVHKGFSPPGNAPGEKPEKSTNFELGSRFANGKLTGEFIGYFNDYTNLLGSDLAASGGTGSLDQFNAGSVHVSGIELLLNYNFTPPEASIQLPFSFAYTLTNAFFQSSFGSDEDIWGVVNFGDRVPYIPKNQWTLTARLEHNRYEINLSSRFNGAIATQAVSSLVGFSEDVPSNFIVDFFARYHINKQLRLTAQIVNLFNEVYLASRVPAGFRPGHPFGLTLGIQLNL